MHLVPRPGFDWTQVNWGAPDQTRTENCSYCDAKLDRQHSVPLILWDKNGWCAEFCEACQVKWWGLSSGANPNPDPKAAYHDYHDPSCPERHCDYCGLRYRGPAVYCSIECAIADA